jgi:hypothetical protein
MSDQRIESLLKQLDDMRSDRDELLAVLNEIVGEGRWLIDDHSIGPQAAEELVDRARAAIAKAEGR